MAAFSSGNTDEVVPLGNSGSDTVRRSFHSDRGCQDDEKDLEEDFFLDMGEHLDEEVKVAIHVRLGEAA